MEGDQVLELPMQENDAGAETIRGYLKTLLSALWVKEDRFSGKRPFGNSGWKSDLETALVKGGAVKGNFDSEGYLSDVDEDAADELIKCAIAAL